MATTIVYFKVAQIFHCKLGTTCIFKYVTTIAVDHHHALKEVTSAGHFNIIIICYSHFYENTKFLEMKFLF